MANVIFCKDFRLLLEFFNEINNDLPIPLSERVDLVDYARKIIENGVVIAFLESGKIVSAVLFYCNDKLNKKAYLTLLATLKKYKGNGYATYLMEQMEKVSIANGMTSIHLDTECCNVKAIKFYSKCGYSVENSISRVHMVKKIIDQ